jgi:UDP-glucose 4-epimerase
MPDEITKILIIGGDSFLGRNLIQYFISNGGVELYATTRRATIINAQSNKVNFITADLTDASYCKGLPKNVDVVVYLAQSNNYRSFPEGSSDMLLINVVALHKALEWSRINGVSKFIYASSGSVYQPKSTLPFVETDAVNPSNFYASSKLNGELLIRHYEPFFKCFTLRIFSLFGEGQQNMMLPGILEKIKSNSLIQLAKGKGILLTPFYIQDAVKALYSIIYSTQIPSGIYNFSGVEPTDLGSIVQIFEETLKTKALVEVTENTPVMLMADSSKLLKSIDFDSFTPLKISLKNVALNYFKN